jgi:endogenous inhibitor of DNA gyrase (YacG/DUF329 family)
MAAVKQCAYCAKRFPTFRRERAYPHEIYEPARPAYVVMGKTIAEARPERMVPDHGRCVFVRKPISADTLSYYPFCTLRCALRFARAAWGAGYQRKPTKESKHERNESKRPEG